MSYQTNLTEAAMEETPRTTSAEIEENKTGIQNIKCRNLNDKNLNRTKTQDQEKMKITMNSNRSYKIVTKNLFIQVHEQELWHLFHVKHEFVISLGIEKY